MFEWVFFNVPGKKEDNYDDGQRVNYKDNNEDKYKGMKNNEGNKIYEKNEAVDDGGNE